MLQKSICSKCLKDSGMDMREMDDDNYGEFCSARFEKDWDRGLIDCPSKISTMSHKEAFSSCPKKGVHEGAACIAFERES